MPCRNRNSVGGVDVETRWPLLHRSLLFDFDFFLFPSLITRMSYLVTARKWRPMVFEDVVGQVHVATTLRNAITTNRLSHAYIFSGPRGVGKTTMARILAKAVNCRSPKDSNPDNACEICQAITAGRSIDVLEIDGASNRGVEEIRNLRESVRYLPTTGKFKVYIIDEVHMLTKEAFNALLKTLEEPPSHILFVFATTEVHKVPATILSRCQRFDFRRIALDEIIGRLAMIAKHEKITIPEDALLLIAKKADGSLRDAQSIFDQVISFCGETVDAPQIMQALNIVDEELYFRTTSLIKDKDARGGLQLVEEIMNRGYDIKEFLNGLSEHFRNILVAQATQSTKLIETSEAFKKRYEEEARRFSDRDIFRLLKIIGDVSASLKWTDQPRFRLEVGLLRMIKIDDSVQIERLLDEIHNLKKRANGSVDREELEENRRDFKIAGSVKATPPTASTATRVSEPRVPPSPSRDRAIFPSLASTETKVADTPTEQTLVVDRPQEKWQNLVEAATRQKVLVGTMLQQSSFAGIANGVVHVQCPDDVHLATLKRNREYLTDLARQIYGAKLRLEAQLSSEPAERPPTKEHPVISALKRELGAQPIE
jgi:DNA polymerase-3 subunit gamma/tau